MSWLSNIFNSQKSEEQIENDADKQMEQKIVDSLQKIKDEKKLIESQVKDLHRWAEDAILETYAVCFPNANMSYYRDKLRVGLLAAYPQNIGEHMEKVGVAAAEQCDKLVKGYLNQVSLIESKIKLFERLTEEYTQTLTKFRVYRQKAEQMKQHTERLQKMNDDTSHLGTAISSDYELEELNKDIATKQEYLKQLEYLRMEYGDDKNFDNALAYKAEIDKMNTKL